MKKKVISIMLTLVCLLGLSTAVFADEGQPSLPTQESQQVQVPPSETNIVTMSANMGEINADGVRVRSTPSTSGTVLGLLYKGDVVEISDSIGPVYRDGYTWYYVVPVNPARPSGYVAAQYITIYPN